MDKSLIPKSQRDMAVDPRIEPCDAPCKPPTIVKPALPVLRLDAGNLRTATRNIRLMHFLERIALRFNEAGLPLMALKGAALNLTLYRQPHERPMNDLDLMVHERDLPRARELLAEIGARPGEPLVRAYFFPRYYYETEYTAGDLFPVRIDLHVRPLRPLRYGRLLPSEAFWRRARSIAVGDATVLIPGDEDMLIHLAAHAAVHGCVDGKWREDIRKLIDERGKSIDWDRMSAKAERWGLSLPVRETLEHFYEQAALPARVLLKLGRVRVNWRDRLALRQAPRDAEHAAMHVLVNALCTPGPRYVLGYLFATLLPDKGHMATWYTRRHFGWLACAHLIRVIRPPLAGLVRAFGQVRRSTTAESESQQVEMLTANKPREMRRPDGE